MKKACSFEIKNYESKNNISLSTKLRCFDKTLPWKYLPTRIIRLKIRKIRFLKEEFNVIREHHTKVEYSRRVQKRQNECITELKSVEQVIGKILYEDFVYF